MDSQVHLNQTFMNGFDNLIRDEQRKKKYLIERDSK